MEAPLHLLHVVSWPDAGPFEVPGDAPTAAQETNEEQALAREALASLGVDGATLAVRHANLPAAEIVGYARDIGARLIVAGRCGPRPRLYGLGGIAEELIQTAPCDVLLVPERDDASPPLAGRVLVGVDFSSASAGAVRTGLALADALGAEGVDLVHVLEPMPHPVRWIDETLMDLLPGIRERASAALHDLVAEVVPMGGAHEMGLYVERGKGARTVARTAEALRSSVVVVGPHAERPVFDGLLGSVAEGVVRRTTCPVLVARRSAAPEGSPVTVGASAASS